ncbi:MAG TPA: type II toxin-antitoxin system ParD family antitoxin [Sphingobium sp.]
MQYLEAAVILDEAQRLKGKVLFRPTLALAGHGLELMLKACLYHNSISPPTSGKAGHRVNDMWEMDACEPVRGHVYSNAIREVSDARDEGIYEGVPIGVDETALIEEYILALGILHGGAPYPLRYPTDDETLGPVTPWLVRSLRRTADDFLKRPNEFDVMQFQGPSIIRQQVQRDHSAFLERKVVAARASVEAGQGRSNMAVDADFARQALIEGELSGEPRPFDFDAFLKDMNAANG